MESKTIALCADDFGLNTQVSQGILKLVQAGRLSAVSCMVNKPDFNLQAAALSSLKDHVQVGLHFNLTDGNFLSQPQKQCFSLNELLLKSHLRHLNSSLIHKEFNAQLDRFVELMGVLPDFIDGHQHVHQFPIIRPVILELYKQRLKEHKTTIRSTYPAITLAKYQFKGRVLALTGGKKLSEQLKKLAIPHNACFSGVYDFVPGTDYRALFRQWLEQVPTDTLIMCHPGEQNVNLDDSIAPTRLSELEYLSSDEFLSDCQEYQIKLTTSPRSGNHKTVN